MKNIFLISAEGSQHLYIISNEEIKEGDWFMDIKELELFKVGEKSLTKEYS